MIWSLVKILAFIAFVGLLALGGTWLMSLDGGAQLAFGNFEITLSPIRTAILLIALIALSFLLAKLLGLILAFFKFLLGDETAVSRYFNRNREKRGFEALSEGLLALASGDGREALKSASKAERYLARPELTNVLKAQAAVMAGDKRVAERTYRKLIADEKTRFVGVHGIMRQKLAAGDTTTALKLANHAFAIKPQHVETQDVLLRLQAKEGDWSSARETLAAKLKHGAIPKDVHTRRDAVLALSELNNLLDEGKTDDARLAAISVNKKSPDLVPAAILAAKGYIEDGKARRATQVLRAAWSAMPHPDIARAFADIAPDETADERLKRFNTLIRVKPSHPEAKMLLAELHIAAEDFPSARRVVEPLVDENSTARVLSLMAAIERGEGADDEDVREWLTKALAAPRGPQWICENCQTVQQDWAPVCVSCEAFDTLTWREPHQSEQALSPEAAPLPAVIAAHDENIDDDVK